MKKSTHEPISINLKNPSFINHLNLVKINKSCSRGLNSSKLTIRIPLVEPEIPLDCKYKSFYRSETRLCSNLALNPEIFYNNFKTLPKNKDSVKFFRKNHRDELKTTFIDKDKHKNLFSKISTVRIPLPHSEFKAIENQRILSRLKSHKNHLKPGKENKYNNSAIT